MIEYEKQISMYLVQQVYKVLNKVCSSSSDVPEYKIIFNFETKEDINQYIFVGMQYKGERKGVKIIADDIWVKQIDEDNVDQDSNLYQKYELILCYSFDDVKLSIIFDISSKPYVNIFFDYIIKAYFSTKEVYLQKILSKLIYDRYLSNISNLRSYLIFNELSCRAEEELIISKAVSEFFSIVMTLT